MRRRLRQRGRRKGVVELYDEGIPLYDSSLFEPPTKKVQPKRKNRKKNKGAAEIDDDGFPSYDASLFASSLVLPKGLDAEEDWCIGTTFQIKDRVSPFCDEWRHELPDPAKALELRSAIFQHRDEEEYKTYVFVLPF